MTDDESAESIQLETVYDALEDRGRPLATATEVADTLDLTQATASDALDSLAERDELERLDASNDPVLYFPADWAETVDRERVVVFPNRREVVVDRPTQFTRARLAGFAHLVETNRDRGYVYEIRPEDVWNAPHDGLEELLDTVRAVLGERSRSLEDWIGSQWDRAHAFRLYTHEDGYVVLDARSADLLGNVAESNVAEDHIRAWISDTEAWAAEEATAAIKRSLYEAGYPVQDERHLETGEDLDLSVELRLRDYQRTWVDRFLDSGSGVLVGPPGSGKTVAALGIMEAVGGETLILAPSRELVSQWRGEILEKTSLTREQVGEYHGGKKEIRPVTIATYRTAGMDRHRALFEERRWGLVVYDECLTGETIVETPAGRTTFSELDEQYEFENGWNAGIDERVRTFVPGKGQRWTDVTGVFKTEAPVQRIETNTGHTLEATESHTHLVFDPDTCELREQRGVDEGDFLVLPLPDHPDPDTPRSVREIRAELLGWFIGDGHLNEYGHIKFSFADRAQEQIDIIADLCERLDTPHSIFENSRGDLTLFAPNLRDTLGWDGEGGDKTATVSVPSEVYAWSEPDIGALLRGLFDAEGSVDQKHRIQFNTVSPDLAEDVSLLLGRLGMLARSFEIERDEEKHRTVHRITVPTHYNDRFSRHVGFRLDHKRERVEPGESPATGLPIGTYLQRLKSETGLTNERIGDIAGVSKQTVGGVIREDDRLGQPHLDALADGLTAAGNDSFDSHESARRFTGITFERLGEEAGLTSGGAYSQLHRGTEKTLDALYSMVNERQNAMIEHGERLAEFSDLRFLEVTDVTEGGTETVYDFETGTHTFLADGILTHNCHHIPSPVYSRTASLQTRHRLGMSASPIREDDAEEEIFTLIGPPIGTDWGALFDAGYVAEPEVEIRYVPWGSTEARNAYVSARGHERRQAAASNPAKIEEIRHIRREYPDAKTLIFVEYLDQGDAIAEALSVPFVSGETPHARRRRLFEGFRSGPRDVLVVSRIGDEGLDLPEAEVAIAASGLGGSRRQGAQRAGRTMRPVGRARMFVLATRGTDEEEFARRRTQHLSEKGVRVREVSPEDAVVDAPEE